MEMKEKTTSVIEKTGVNLSRFASLTGKTDSIPFFFVSLDEFLQILCIKAD